MAICAAGILASASVDARPSPSDGSASTQRSDTVIRKAGSPKHAGIATLTMDLTIGSESAGDAYLLSNVSEIFPTSDGGVLVLDSHAPVSIRKYDASGRFEFYLGRRGQGPGEYLSPSGITQTRDSTILVHDSGNGRINLYSAAGAVIGQWHLPGGGDNAISRPDMLTVDTADVAYVRVRMPQATAAAGQEPSWGLLRMRDGVTFDTIAPPFPDAPRRFTATRVNGQSRSSTSVQEPYPSHPLWTLSPLGYLITGIPTRYAVDLRIPPPRATGAAPSRGGASASALPTWRAGNPVVSIRRDVTPIPVPEAERTVRRASIENRLKAFDPAWRWTGPDSPKFKPAYDAIRVAVDGRIWLRASMASEYVVPQTPPTGAPSGPQIGPRWAEPIVYDVFDPDGSYVGQVSGALLGPSWLARGDAIWTVNQAMDGVPYVRRYRVAWK
jgi:hypothetical protein